MSASGNGTVRAVAIIPAAASDRGRILKGGASGELPRPDPRKDRPGQSSAGGGMIVGAAIVRRQQGLGL